MTAHDHYDVLIVGGGPAGSGTAIRLAQNGLKVLVVEQKKFPRPKLCGEFISPECVTHFAELGVLEDISLNAAPIGRTVFYARNGRSVAIPSEWFATGSPALGLSRAKMDALLLQRARAAGANILEDCNAAGLMIEEKKVVGIRLKQPGGDVINVQANLVIDATGRSRRLVREIEKGEGFRRPARAAYVAFKAHLDNAAVADGDCEIYAYRGGYGGCSRIEDGLHNLCFIVSADLARRFQSDLAALVEQVVCTNKRATLSLQDAGFTGAWLAVPIERYGRGQLAPAEGLLAVGDAASFIDPFTGSGILIALESGKVAAKAIAEFSRRPGSSFTDLAREYQNRYSAAFDRRLRVSSWIRHAAFVPFLAETVIRTLALNDHVTRFLARATRPARPTSSFPQG
jgi:menaquinone-9 beta-reductase